LFLQYSPKGDFFSVSKAWELVDGKVAPFFHEDVVRAMRGISQYAGMDEAAFLETLQQLAAQKQNSPNPR